MIAHVVRFLAGDTDDGVDAAAGIALMVMAFMFGMTIAQISLNNRLMRDIGSYLQEQRRLAVAAARRDFAAKERPDA